MHSRKRKNSLKGGGEDNVPHVFFFKQKEELHKSSNFWLKTSCKKNVLQQCSIQRELHFTSHIRF